MKQGIKQLFIQTGSLISGFIVWVLISSLMPFIQDELKLSSIQTAWATAIPVILGSLLRIPIGYLTNLFGARKIFTISFLILLFPIFLISYAHSFSTLMLGGFFLGIAGAIFSIGVTSLPKYFNKAQHGLINGIYGAGNIGTAITTFFAPVLADTFGWRSSVRVFLMLVLLSACINFLFGDQKEDRIDDTSLTRQVKQVYRNHKLWFLSLFYFITFGSFVAFTIYLPSFLVNHFDLEKVDAGLRTAGFIALATIFRPLGGWLSDKVNPYLLLMGVFCGLTFSGFLLSFTPSLPIYSFGCLLVSVCAGVGNGVVFKLVPMYFFKQSGTVNGIVAASGGFGGFFPPIILSALYNLTGHYAIGFMALSELSLACFILVLWLYYQEKLEVSNQIVEHAVYGICITDVNGSIQHVNPSFTRITGYGLEEVIGKTPSVLQSGEHNCEFYKQMWNSLLMKGFWEGYIWNRRKNDEVYKEWLSITAIKDESGETRNYVGMFYEAIKNPQNNT